VRFPRWAAAPYEADPIQRKNFVNVQIDAIGIGFANAASPFLPVFLTRLGATNSQIGLLTAMPGITGLLLAVIIGSFLQSRRNIVPWFSGARLLTLSAYAATGIAPFFVPEQYLVWTILAIWAIATIPQTALAVCFSVVMNAVAGPKLRYDLMSRRWSILGMTTAVTVLFVGQFLERVGFPINYQLVFIGLSAGGLVSFYFSSRISLPDIEPPPVEPGRSLRKRLSDYRQLVFSHPDFVQFSSRRFVFTFGWLLAVPLMPLYYVREIDASDAWIGAISTIQTAVLVVGYFFWTRQSRRKGSRFVLLWSTLGLSIYPALVAATQRVELIALYAGLAGIFQAGIDLVFFDELMKTVPPEYSATFVSINQMLQYASSIFAPLLGTLLATSIGLEGALLVSSAIRFAGFGLFVTWRPPRLL
jgi:hypothetical protein